MNDRNFLRMLETSELIAFAKNKSELSELECVLLEHLEESSTSGDKADEKIDELEVRIEELESEKSTLEDQVTYLEYQIANRDE